MPDKKIYSPLTDTESVLSVLDKIAIFGGLSNEQLHNVFSLLKKVTYNKNEIIFKQGEPPSHIYIVRSGKVKLYIEVDQAKLELIEFDVGSCFGESSLIGIQAHTASALAVEETELIVLSGQTLLSLYESNKDIFGMIILNIARETCRRLHQADDALLHYVLDKNN